MFIIDCTEEYTKTCTRCGIINNNSEVFKCPNCNLEIDRDINGARMYFTMKLRFPGILSTTAKIR